MYLLLDNKQVMAWSETDTIDGATYVELSILDVDKLQRYPLGVLQLVDGVLKVNEELLMEHEVHNMLMKLDEAFKQQSKFPIPLRTPNGVFYVPNNMEVYDYIESSIAILKAGVHSSVPLVVYQEDIPYKIDIELDLANNIHTTIHAHRHNLFRKYRIDKYTEVLSATTLEDLSKITI